MSNQCVIAEYESIEDANVALEVLETDSFGQHNVSVITQGSEKEVGDVGKIESHASDSPEAKESIGTGAAVGGSLAIPIAASTMIGPFMVAGPLAGLAVGAVAGGLLSSTERWGVDYQAANDYQQRVEEGSVLVIVSDEDPIRVNDALQLLKTCDHKSIASFRVE